MTSPTERSLAALRKQGWEVAVVEKWNPHIKIRQDLFGFADLIAFKEGETPRLIQTTDGSNFSKRLDKIRDNPKAARAVRAGFSIHIHGWRLLASSKRHECRITVLSEADLPCPPEPSCSSSSGGTSPPTSA